ncbi:hypothetical protein [Bacillus sp. REN10]|uniref:hypothetical protein n=1 Tax=Bacillus sp. REN10 TaxID=2782541 RepID=UPI00193B0630|nr:hypothetical protein [Bacillus sp. REN10]
MNVKEEKLKRIDEIYSSWRGGFLHGDVAMSEIGNVLRNTVGMNTIQVIDTSTGECVANFQSATAVVIKQ